jgi:hypothetical protein
MKFNWGTGILTAFIAFMAFILYFVVLASTDQRANHDLVTDNYYEDELGYQRDIDAMANARDLDGQVAISKNARGMVIQFPESWANGEIKGKVTFYRPSNKKLDFELPILPVGSRMEIPSARLPEGRWDIAVRWNRHGKDYLVRESLNYTEATPINND